jgi:hypothetical protein
MANSRRGPFGVRLPQLPLAVALTATLWSGACKEASAPLLPGIVERISADIVAGQVATQHRFSVLVTDINDTPVPNTTVAWTADGGGSVDPPSSTTNSAGEAHADWSFGTVPGSYAITATVEGVTPLVYSTNAGAGPPASISPHGSPGQSASVGATIFPGPAVIVHDAFGNGVPDVEVQFVVTAGGGSTPSAPRLTNLGGVATAEGWTLGAQPGANTLVARVSPLPDVTFSITGRFFSLSFGGIQLNQGTQTLQGDIPAVAGRPALLRVIVRSDQPNSLNPMVRLRLFAGNTLIREDLLQRNANGVPVNPDLSDPAQSWNVVLPASDIVPNLRAEAYVDQDATVPDVATAQMTSVPLNPVTLAPLRIVFIPVHSTIRNATGNISVSNVDAFLTATRQWIPSSTILPSFHSTYTTGLDLSLRDAWSLLLAELQVIRILEGATDEYYHGIIPNFPGIALGGLAFRPSSPASLSRTGLTYDGTLSGTSVTLPHELGHNLGRRHAPCGGPDGVDPLYPHSGALIGALPFDIVTSQLMPAGPLRDFMSYCHPRWASDYTYDGILQWRLEDPYARFGALPPAAELGRQEGLLLWGTIGANGVTLNPAFSLSARPALPESNGPNQLRGVATDGTVLFAYGFSATPIADAADGMEEGFTYFVPLSTASIDRLDRIELVTPRGQVVNRSSGAAGVLADAVQSQVTMEARTGDLFRMRWDSGRFPMALVRDAITGQVISIARGGDVDVSSNNRTQAQLEVYLSDGVRSTSAVRRQ